MDYQEAMEKHKKDCRRCREKIYKHAIKKFSCLQEIDIKAYEELMSYRRIGTLDEVREAVERFGQNAWKWIPVQERLPEKDEIVLVSQTYNWERFEDCASVTIGRLHPREKNGKPYWEFQYYRPDFKHGTIMDNGIICPGSEYIDAWMPLPKPYRPDLGDEE